jgi:hypothetical protein
VQSPAKGVFVRVSVPSIGPSNRPDSRVVVDVTVGGLVSELNRYRAAVRERRRTAGRTRSQPARPAGLRADRARGKPATRTSMTAAPAKTAGGQAGRPHSTAPEEI